MLCSTKKQQFPDISHWQIVSCRFVITFTKFYIKILVVRMQNSAFDAVCGANVKLQLWLAKKLLHIICQSTTWITPVQKVPKLTCQTLVINSSLALKIFTQITSTGSLPGSLLCYLWWFFYKEFCKNNQAWGAFSCAGACRRREGVVFIVSRLLAAACQSLQALAGDYGSSLPCSQDSGAHRF